MPAAAGENECVTAQNLTRETLFDVHFAIFFQQDLSSHRMAQQLEKLLLWMGDWSKFMSPKAGKASEQLTCFHSHFW